MNCVHIQVNLSTLWDHKQKWKSTYGQNRYLVLCLYIVLCILEVLYISTGVTLFLPAMALILASLVELNT